jgi:PKD repeat protein
MKSRILSCSLLLCLAIAMAASPGFAVPPGSNGGQDRLEEMIKDGWVVVAPGVLQRSLGDHKIETMALGPEGFAWTAKQLQGRLGLLLEEYRVRPTANLKKAIRSLRRKIQGLREQSRILGSEPAYPVKTSCNETYSAQANAYPTTPGSGVRADADASFSNDCGYSGDTYAYAYAETNLNGTFTTLTQSDLDPGVSVSSHATASLAGTSQCYSFAYASVTSGALGIDYSQQDETFACQPPAARFSFTCAQLSCSFNATASTTDPFASYAWTFGDSTSGSGATVSHTFPATGVYTVTLTITNRDGETSSVSRKVSVTDEPAPAAENYFAVAPCRLIDTRNSGILSSGQVYVFNIAGSCGIPATAKAVSFNVGVTAATGPGHLKFYPGDRSSNPFVSSAINFIPDSTSSIRFNNAILRLATNGAGTVAVQPVVFATPGEVHVILDVNGYFSEDTAPAAGAQGPLGYQTVTPCRIADTRSTAPLSHGVPRNFTVEGVCGVPASGSAVGMLNVTAITPSEAGLLAVFPVGAPFPPVATVRFLAGILAQANGARTALSSAGPDVTVQFQGLTSTAGTTHVTLDVFGYFKSDAPLKYRPVTPCRLVDTRFADQGSPALAASETRSFQVQGNCGVPVGAKAAMLNVVSVNPAGPGHLLLYPSGTSAPVASALNFHPMQGNLANGIIAPLSVQANDLAVTCGVSSTDVVIDVFGYFE